MYRKEVDGDDGDDYNHDGDGDDDDDDYNHDNDYNQHQGGQSPLLVEAHQQTDTVVMMDDGDDYDDDDDDRHRRSYTHAGGPSPPLHLVRFPNPVLLVCYWTSMYTHLSIVYYLYILISSFHCTP